MKKILSVLSILGACLTLGGCNNLYTRSAKNTIEYIESNVTNIDELVNNIKTVSLSVDAIKGDYVLINTKDRFSIEFNLLTDGDRKDWDGTFNLNGPNISSNIYLKDEYFYFIYPHNQANVIVKDKMIALVDELEVTLDLLKATYEKEEFEDLFIGDKLAGLKFDYICENGSYSKLNDGYKISYVNEKGIEVEMIIDSNYLIKSITSKAINFTSTLNLKYPEEVKFTYPMGLDFLTIDIKSVKKMLKVDSFAQLIDPSIEIQEDVTSENE